MTLILNRSSAVNSQQYTESKIEQTIISIEEKVGALDGDSIATEIEKKATAVEIAPSDVLRLVKYNEQGVVTEGKVLVATEPLEYSDGVISHAKQSGTEGLGSTSFGYGDYIPEIKVDDYGHITSIRNRTAYTIAYAPVAGQVLRGSDTNEYKPETVDSTVTMGSNRLVTSDAVAKAIASASTSVYRVKGSCTKDELDANYTAEVGDVWNVTDGANPGANYVWVGASGDVPAHWDKLSETLDLSIYLEKDALDDHLGKVGRVDQWGHVKTSDTVPLADSEHGSPGTDNGQVARADHSHPIVTGAVIEGSILPVSGDTVNTVVKTLIEQIKSNTDRYNELIGTDGKIKDDYLPTKIRNEWGTFTGDITAQEDLIELVNTKAGKKIGRILIPSSGWAGDEVLVPVFDDEDKQMVLSDSDAVFIEWGNNDCDAYASTIEYGQLKFVKTTEAMPAESLQLRVVIL